MIEFVNKRSGLIFLVADERKDEYLEAGHRLASDFVQKPEEKPEPEKEVKEEPKAVKKSTKTSAKKPAKKTTAKKR